MNKDKTLAFNQLRNDLQELAAEKVGDTAWLLIPKELSHFVFCMDEFIESTPIYLTLPPYDNCDGKIFGCLVRFEERYSIDLQEIQKDKK